MSTTPGTSASDNTDTVALEADARALAEAQRHLQRSSRLASHFFARTATSRPIDRAQRHLSDGPLGNTTLEHAAEWFLDNYYLIRRVARQVEEELPRGFVRHLPLLALGPAKGRPRIEILARAVVARTGVLLDPGGLRRFAVAYQEVSPLTIAELWALPTMLRTAVLHSLVDFLGVLGVPVRNSDDASFALFGEEASSRQSTSLAPLVGVERSIRALRVLDSIDWKVFFQNTNRVETILRTDPSNLYPRMDFETCDSYRKVVESLAWDTGSAEEDVASLAVTLARGDSSDERRGHVGYYLVADGRSVLEQRLGYRPIRLDRVRRLVTSWPTLSYLLPLALLTSGSVLALAWYLIDKIGRDTPSLLLIAVVAIVACIPVSSLAVTLLQLAFARLLPPRTLPKLDFQRGLPDDVRTLVVIPTLMGRTADVVNMTRQVELHYLSNPDPQLQFALLTDAVDRREPATSSDDELLLESASQTIAVLNSKHGKNGHGPFHLLHREPRWNPAEQRIMGWERKRGKLEELNRLLRGDKRTSYSRHVGDPEGLLGIRFVITLDSDTQLPMGTAQRLIGVLAHPLNRPVFDTRTDRVSAGYTVVQPRVETSPSSARRTRFSQIFSGDVGFDIYTHAYSELYQDLFGSGIYVGKGIYDVDAFMRSLAGRTPENALLSHDLFEGIHGRAALATDIVLFEGYPETYATYATRMHRWVRGDWQLVPWLFAKVPSAHGGKLRNGLACIDRWKIVDNLRRSLVTPLSLVLLILSWTWLPGNAALWTLGTLTLFLAPFTPALATGRIGRASLGRGALAIAFLVYDAWVVADAITRVLVRKTITRKHLLEWTSAENAAFETKRRSPFALYWQTMLASPLVATACAALVAWARPSALVVAAPFLLTWLCAPEIARWVSQPPRKHPERLSDEERRKLRLLARRTWRFFDMFVGPNDQWLPIDNYQEEPREQTAHRTSPTNIGLALLATMSAYDFGYIGPSELSLRLRMAFDSITRLTHYQGHLFNWYDTKNLQPLPPRYVSTVDSGNFAGCLLALKHGCKEAALAPVLRAEAWEGLRDSIELLEEVVERAPSAEVHLLRPVIERMRQACLHARDNLQESYPTLQLLGDELSKELDRELLAFVESGAHRYEPDLLRALRTSIDRLHQQLQHMRRELDALLPWLALKTEAAAHALQLPTDLGLGQIPDVSKRLRRELGAKQAERHQRGEVSSKLDASARRLNQAFLLAQENAEALVLDLESVAQRADREVREMDFRLVYDSARKLFHIGYNATVDQVDDNYYDLLASEARLASYVAIVKRDVPESHWYALGRPMTRVVRTPTLLSWGGTMFEYLMPNLLMRSQPGTLLARACAAAVEAQIAHGKNNHEPWGVSESAYAKVDANQTYSYRSFGVPGLGFKRGLDEDRVITPYASMLALSIRPRAVVDNLKALEALGMRGTYGLFEALDFTPERNLAVASKQPVSIVRSYMAHHQGMLLVALGNFLNTRSMVRRFHADALVATGEVLLNEHAPATAPPEWPGAEASKTTGPVDEAPALPSAWLSTKRAGPQAFVLSNGHFSSLLTASGGGGLLWNGVALTRHEPDATCDTDGVWLYLRDEETRRVWRAISAEGRTTYAMHEVEFHVRNEGISVHVDVTVAPRDDVEVRQITLHNETTRARRLTVASAGRPVLLNAGRAPTHPAFSSMFVQSEFDSELDALVFARRPQTAEEEPVVLVHRLVHGDATTFAGYESERTAFFGRRGSLQVPLLLAETKGTVRGRVGDVIDPIMSVMARVSLQPKHSVTLAFVTTVARSRGAALDLARKYGSMHTVRWAFRDAEQEGPRRLQRAKLDPALLPTVQRFYSALLFADATLRAPPRAGVAPCQQRLWARGISGDDPIVLVRVNDPDAVLVREALAVQRYLRTCGVRLDLVLVDEQASGYLSEGLGTLRNVLMQNDASDSLNQRGGVYLIAADQIPEPELLHLEACARLVLDTRDGPLAAHFERAPERSAMLPHFEATLFEEAAERPRPRPELLFDNGTGGFSVDGREYILEVSPKVSTPAPWCNVLANPEFGCLVSESSLGASWSLNSGENRLTPWRNDPVLDTPSEVLYLRDEETAAVWSPTPLPGGRAGPTLVRHGAGYTTYELESHGLVQKLTIFVPHDAPLKVARLRVKNLLAHHRRLTVTYYAEWVLGSRREVQRPYIVSDFDEDHACLLATCDWAAEFGGRVAFLASAGKPHGFTTDRTEFLGTRGDYASPAALQRWGLSGRINFGADPCAALQVHLDIAPGQEVETHFLLGQSSNREEAQRLVTRFRDEAVVETAWTELHAFWDDILGSVRVKTPEPSMDLMLNRWLLYQSLSSRVFGRTGFYQSSGAFGYRDQLQDVLALLHAAPELARAHILEAARHQFKEGDVLHWWHPPSGRGVRTRCSDDLAWLVYVTGEYVSATGDGAILEQELPFLEGEPLKPGEHDRYAQYEVSLGSAPLFEHCRKAVERAVTEGVHGLPLMGDGDWNDGMSSIGRLGRGESVWLGWFLCATMDRFADLSTRQSDHAGALEWHAKAESLRARITDIAWDGKWYLRAFHDDGSLVGSATSRECRIDSIAQSWAVLSNTTNKSHGERTIAAVRAADTQLVREDDRLVLLFWPPFDNTLHNPGYVRAYPPGVRENGGQYTHAATWLGFAHAALADGESAERIFRLLNPVLRTSTGQDSARYRVEPYALAADIYSCPPWVGRGGWTWYTGAAAWMWRLGVEAILGLRREEGHLRIDPCIPPSWRGFEAWVRVGKQRAHIVVENPDRVATGVAAISLNGSVLDSPRIHLGSNSGGEHEIRVRMGSGVSRIPRSVG